MLAVLLPFRTSLLVRTYAWLVLLQKKGLLNEFAMSIGLWENPIKLVHNLTGTLIGMAHIMLPFLVLPLYGSMRKINRDLMHAAANLSLGLFIMKTTAQRFRVFTNTHAASHNDAAILVECLTDCLQ